MSELSKQALVVDNNQSFPNNNAGAITPSVLRAFNTNMIDSTVNQTQYTSDSGSWNAQIDALEAFTASAITSAITASSLITASFDNGTRNLTFTKGNNTTFAVNIPDVSGSSFNTGSFATTGSNTFTGNQNISGSIFFPNGAEIRGTAGQQTVIASNTNLQINPSSSMGINAGSTVGISGSNVFIQNLRYPNFDGTAGQVLSTDGAGILTFTTVSGSGTTINTGSFATTGSNLFTGNQTFVDPSGNSVLISDLSGSFFLVSDRHTSSLAPQITGSNLGGVNLSFLYTGPGAGVRIGASNGGTSNGSGNIFSFPNSAALGRQNYIGGNSNIFLNGQSLQLPTLTGSAATVSGNTPTMHGNYIAGTQTWLINQAVNPGAHTYNNNMLLGTGGWTFNTMGNTGQVTVSNNIGQTSALTLNSPSRSVAEINTGASGSNLLSVINNLIQGAFIYNGPVSSSTHQISNNNIAGGITFNVQSQSRVITAGANIVNGTLIYTDNTVFAPTLGSNPSISNNNINGTATFISAGSSSFQVQNNNLNTVTVTSFLDASAVTTAPQRISTLNGNAIFGTNNSILFSGSIGVAPTGRTLAANLIAGQFISASLIGDGSGSNMFATTILGGGLNVIGTTTILTAGIQQNYGSAFFGRWNATDGNKAKTAETIFAVGTGTSGSTGITRKTGFLIDSGSNSYFEGNVNVSGSLTVQSGSTFFANGNRQFNVGAFQSGVTQSGSANVSQSMNFETTDISSGVSIASNSRITLANSGTYNIQFSAQTQATGGADNLYIWLKKNGTNVNGSAGNVEIANNAEIIAAWNYVVDAAAGDYFELAWQAGNIGTILLAAGASGNIPSIPSVILTVTQVR